MRPQAKTATLLALLLPALAPAAGATTPDALLEQWRAEAGASGQPFAAARGRQLFETTAVADRVGVDGVVNGVATAVRETSGRLRRLQNGLVRTYAVGVSFGAVALMVYFFLMAKVG